MFSKKYFNFNIRLKPLLTLTLGRKNEMQIVLDNRQNPQLVAILEKEGLYLCFQSNA